MKWGRQKNKPVYLNFSSGYDNISNYALVYEQKGHKEDMKPMIEPDFYNDFHCIGGQCSFTCCKEWKIAVDPETKKRWRKLSVPETVLESGRVPEHACVHASKSTVELYQFVTKKDGADVIELLPNMRCPFLEDTELCRLVMDYGEECLSKTCHVFPRETHEFPDRTERTLVSCCPEIVDRLHDLHKLNFTNLPYQDRTFLLEGKDKLFQIRNIMMYYLDDDTVSNEVNLKRTLFMLQDLLDKKAKGTQPDPGECLKEEDVQKLTEMILSMPKDTKASIEEQNALFLDITENYRKEGRYQGLLNPLCKTAEELSRAFQEEDTAQMKSLCAVHAEVVAAYTPLLRNYLVAEAFATLLIPGCTLRDMVLQLEWMIMEYVLIVHAMVLQMLCEKDRPLTYPKARELLILIARMTGYDGDEIEDYLRESFENPIWPWGYANYLLS